MRHTFLRVELITTRWIFFIDVYFKLDFLEVSSWTLKSGGKMYEKER